MTEMTALPKDNGPRITVIDVPMMGKRALPGVTNPNAVPMLNPFDRDLPLDAPPAAENR